MFLLSSRKKVKTKKVNSVGTPAVSLTIILHVRPSLNYGAIEAGIRRERNGKKGKPCIFGVSLGTPGKRRTEVFEDYTIGKSSYCWS